MKASVNKELCIGCGACTSICPAVFELGDNYVSMVIVEYINETEQDCADNAAASCPVGAITLE